MKCISPSPSPIHRPLYVSFCVSGSGAGPYSRLLTSPVDSKNGGLVMEKSNLPSSSRSAVRSGPGASSLSSSFAEGTSRTDIWSWIMDTGAGHHQRGGGRKEVHMIFATP